MEKMEDYYGKLLLHNTLFELSDPQKQIYKSGSAVLDFRLIGANDDQLYWGRYDPEGKSFKFEDYDWTDLERETWPKFSIPKDIIERPDSLSQQEINWFNQQSIHSAGGYAFIGEELTNRLTGKSLCYTIDGMDYVLDTSRMELRRIDQPHLSFKFTSSDLYHPSLHFYDPRKKTPIDPIDRAPIGSVAIVLPALGDIDLIGVNMKHPEARPYENICYLHALPTHFQIKGAVVHYHNREKKFLTDLMHKNSLYTVFTASAKKPDQGLKQRKSVGYKRSRIKL